MSLSRLRKQHRDPPSDLMTKYAEPFDLHCTDEEGLLTRQQKAPVVFFAAPDVNLICPLHGGLLRSPVLGRCGHTFCKECVEMILKRGGPLSCPTCGMALGAQVENFFPNLAVMGRSLELLVHCRFSGMYSPPTLQHEELSVTAPHHQVPGSNAGTPVASHSHHSHSHKHSATMKGGFIPEGGSSIHRSHSRAGSSSTPTANGGTPPDQSPNQLLSKGSSFATGTSSVPFQFGVPGLPHGGPVVSAELMTHWKFYPEGEGCSELLKLSEMEDHVRSCPFARIHCPNSDLCPLLRPQDLTQHLKVCRNATAEKDVSPPELVRAVREAVAIAHAADERYKSVLCEIDELRSTFREREQGLQTTLDSLKMEFDLLKRTFTQIRMVGGHTQQHIFSCAGTLVGHTGPVWALACGYGHLISGSSDGTCKVWDLGTLGCVAVLEGHTGIVVSLAVHGSTLFSGSSEGEIKRWDLKTFQLLSSTKEDDIICKLTIFDPSRGIKDGADLSGMVDGPVKRMPVLLLAGMRCVTRIYNASTMELVAELTGHNHFVRALAVHGTTLYTGSFKAIKVWSLSPKSMGAMQLAATNKGAGETFPNLTTIPCPDGSVYSLAVDSNGRVYAGTYEAKIHVYERKKTQSDYELIAVLEGHAGVVYDLAIRDSGNSAPLLFSASYDRSVKVWDIATMACVQTLIRHESVVDALAIYGERIFTASADHSIKVWN